MNATTAKTVGQLVGEARGRVENLGPGPVAAEAAAGKALLVDLREQEERLQNGSIPGAIHAPRGMLEFWADPSSPYHRKEFDPGQRVILYCASGGRSALAAKTLTRLGYSQVAHLDGGFKAWKDTGQAVETVHLSPAEDTFRQAIDAFNQHDAAAFAGFYTVEAVVQDPQYPQPLQGREAIQRDIEAFFRTFPDARATVIEAIGAGQTAAIECSVTGTHEGPMTTPMGDVPATGKPIQMAVAMVSRVGGDGRITEQRRYYDLAGMMAQLSLDT